MNTTPTAWRYLNVACAADDLPPALEKFGAEGWELAAALPMNFPAQGRLLVSGEGIGENYLARWAAGARN